MEIDQHYETHLRFSFEILLFHSTNFSSNEVNLEVAVIIFSDGPCKLELKLFSLSKKSERNGIFKHQSTS